MKGVLDTAVVCVKRTLDYTVKPRVQAGATTMQTEGLKHSINPFCEIAVEEAVRLKERNVVRRVVAVSVGGPGAEDVLRHALAMGVDEAVLITSPFKPDIHLQPLPTAKVLRRFIETQNAQLVLLGKQSIDGDNRQVPQLLAGLLGWPQAICVHQLEVSGAADDPAKTQEERKPMFTATREVDSALQTARFAPPAVVSCDLRLNMPRFATLPNLMKAKKKKISVVAAETLVSEADLAPRLEIVSIAEPPRRKPGQWVANVDELIEKLITEAKVIHS
ncbi:putative electron transfer flavoprotein subunit beta [Toxoplasma gondii GT1]|uniref:Electron transfer flavoprotein subunit beta n=1 Tax=Toxoplasma gondii (strain ATCC 50853 / GT1) TaxID=507601 RepID=S7VVZ2_TOXGG|nr:putative electron transfer flavoprotein subunit beta [Toxoplasma gondii GT1]